MRFTDAQVRVLRLMGQTGVIKRIRLVRLYPRWKATVAALIGKGVVEQYGVDCYALTPKMTSHMPAIMDWPH